MNDFCIDFSRLLKNNETVKLNVANSSKGPHAGNKVQITKDNNRTHYYYDKPTTIDVGGKKIKNVIDYSTIKFKDGTTNNGQSFDITTTKSHINAYTHDNKFYV